MFNYKNKNKLCEYLEDSELIWKENILKWCSIRLRRFWVVLSKKYFFGFENFSMSQLKKNFSWKKIEKKNYKEKVSIIRFSIEDSESI